MTSLILLYIDPGSGSLLFQALVSGFLTVVIFFKRIVAYVKYLFLKGKTKKMTMKKIVQSKILTLKYHHN